MLKRSGHTKIPVASLPKGYYYSLFKEGDEKEWAVIETSVGEFENESKALSYFQLSYLPYSEKVKKRTIFVVAEHGEKIATFTAWHIEVEGKIYPAIHWVACKPNYQGLGIGKSLISYGVSLMKSLDGDKDMYIPTQTWSHKAIRLYQWVGFNILEDHKKYGKYTNQGIEGLDTIKELIKKTNK